MIRAAVALFGAGVASFLAPCVLPLVPAYVGMMVGVVSDGSSGPSGSGDTAVGRRALVGSSLAFVAGFTAVFVAFGTAAGAIGSAYERARGAVQLVGGVAVVVFGLAMLGRVRGPLARTARPFARRPAATDTGATARSGRVGAGPARAAVMGVTFGAAWTPCVGPLLGAALVTASRSGGPWRGGVLLAAYAAGLGAPFVAAALGLDAFPGLARSVLRAGRRPGATLQRVGGVVLVVLGVLVVSGRYSGLVSALARLRA